MLTQSYTLMRHDFYQLCSTLVLLISKSSKFKIRDVINALDSLIWPKSEKCFCGLSSLDNFDALQLSSNLHATSTVSDQELLVESLLVTE